METQERGAEDGRPIPFIIWAESEHALGMKLVVTEEARIALNRIQGPVSVVCAVGPVGAGKSTVVNRALLQLEPPYSSDGHRGFMVVGEQSRAEESRSDEGIATTQGIWLWSSTLPATASDGTDVNLIVLETQGLPYASGEDANGCACVADPEDLAEAAPLLAIARLLSTCILFVSPAGVTDDALAALAAALDAAPLDADADADADADSASPWEDGRGGPRLLWAARDLSGPGVPGEPGRPPLPARQHLERALRDPPAGGGGGGAVADDPRRRARARVRRAFPDRDCVPLSRPAGCAASPAAIPPHAGRGDSDRQVAALAVSCAHCRPLAPRARRRWPARTCRLSAPRCAETAAGGVSARAARAAPARRRPAGRREKDHGLTAA